MSFYKVIQKTSACDQLQDAGEVSCSWPEWFLLGTRIPIWDVFGMAIEGETG